MGVVQVTATVRNPAEPHRAWDGLFLVDTGSTDCVVPTDALYGIGLRPQGSRSYELADGRKSTVDIAVARIEFMGEFVGATVGFGPDDVEPILGLTALESVGIEIDVVSQRLIRRHAVRMKSMYRLRASMSSRELHHAVPALPARSVGKATLGAEDEIVASGGSA